MRWVSPRQQLRKSSFMEGRDSQVDLGGCYLSAIRFTLMDFQLTLRRMSRFWRMLLLFPQHMSYPVDILNAPNLEARVHWGTRPSSVRLGGIVSNSVPVTVASLSIGH